MTERSESERAELVALADRLAVFTKYGPSTIFEQHLSGNQLQLIVTALLRLAAQDQKPAAWAYEAETLLGTWERHVSFHKPQGEPWRRNVEPLFLSPPPAAGWDGGNGND